MKKKSNIDTNSKNEDKQTSNSIIKKYKLLDKKVRNYICLAIIIILIAIIFFTVKAIKENNSYNYTSTIDDNENNYSKTDNSSSYISCKLTDSQSKEKNAYFPYDVYGVGDYLNCTLNNYKYDISEISFNVNKNDDLDLVDVYSKEDKWIVTKKDYSVSLLSKKSDAKTDDVILRFYIKNKILEEENRTIKINSVRFTNWNGKNYLDNVKGYKIKYGENRHYLEDGVIIFEKLAEDGSFKKVNEYKCKTPNSCYANVAKEGFSYKGESSNTIMLEDKENDKYISILFDYDKGIIGTYGNTTSWLYSDEYEYQNGTYIYIKSKDSDQYGIIDKNGNVIHEFNLGSTNAFYKSGLLTTAYSIENDMIIDQKDNKYGVSKITSNDIIIDYKFDSIRFIVNSKSNEEKTNGIIHYYYEKTVDNKYFKAKLDGKWYLYSFDTKDKVIAEGYDDLFVANDKIIVAEIDKKLYIKDYEGNNLIEETIEDLSREHYEYVCCGMTPGVKVEAKDNIVTIIVYKDNAPNDVSRYEYNISTKTLTNKK